MTDDIPNPTDPNPTGGAATTQRVVEELVDNLSSATAKGLFDQLNLKGQPHLGGKIGTVRQTFLKRLNARRPERVRRLFTNCFQPFLAGDPKLLAKGRTPNGVVHRIDVAALWFLLSRHAFPELVAQATLTINQMAASELVDDVLFSPEALAIRDRLRLDAVDYLNVAAGGGKPAMDKLLGAMSLYRNEELKRRGLQPEAVRRLTIDDITALRDILTANAELLTSAELTLSAVRDDAHQPEAAAALLVEACAELALALAGTPVKDDIVNLLPLTILNTMGDFRLIGHYLRLERDETRAAAIEKAAIEHFADCCGALEQTVDQMAQPLARNERITVPESTFVALEGQMKRFEAIFAALKGPGAVERDQFEQSFRDPLNKLFQAIDSKLAQQLNDRAVTAAEAGERTPDLATLKRLLGFLRELTVITKRYGYTTSTLSKWHADVSAALKSRFDTFTRLRNGRPARADLPQVARIGELCLSLGLDFVNWLEPSRYGLLDAVQRALETEHPLTAGEQAVAKTVIDKSRVELAKIRYWKAPVLADLVQIADRHEL